MKKSITFYLSIFIANTAWGDCSLTNATLKQGGTVNYDDYLYPDSMQYELRNENNPNSKAYLCGAGYCAVGTKIRLPNAKAGNSYTISDAVYECKNSSSSGRTSYQWVVSAVDSNCIITPPQISKTVSPMEVKNAGTLYMVGSKYCSSVNEVHKEAGTNFWDAAKSSGHDTAKTIQTWFNGLASVNIATINGGIEIIKNNTERMRIFTNGTVSVINNNVQTAGQIISSTWESTTDGFVKIHDINSRTVIGGLQIAKDGTVKIFNSTSQVITTIAKERGESYRATLGFFGGIISGFNADIQTAIKTAGSIVNTGIKETGATIRNFFDNSTSFGISAINGGVELAKNNTERIRIFANGTVSVINTVTQTTGQTITTTWETTKDGIVKIHDINSRTFIGGLQIAKDGTVKIITSTNKVIMTLAKESGESYRATLGFFGNIITSFNDTVQTTIKSAASVINTGIQETGATIRNFFDNSTSFGISAINGGVELAKNNTERIRIFANGTVSVINTVTQTTGQTITTTWETTKDGIVKIHDINSRTFIGGLQIAKDGTVKIITSANKVIMTLAKESGESYRATLSFFGNIITSFNDTVQTTIKSAAQVAGITIHELAETARSAMNNATDFAKHFTTEIVGGVKAYGINKAKLKELEERIAKCQTQEQVAELIAKALREAELSEAQCAQVRQMINQYAQTQNQRFDVIEGKLGSLEQELREIQQQNIEFSYQIANLGSQYNSLAAEVRTKVSAKQVINLINERTQSFSEGQKRELYVILGEYTKKLSDGQRAEVQQMIALYVDPKIAQLGGRIDLESNRRVAENKVLSAMSTLNAFAASAKVSVWKTADGKFNGARLASDSIAGVVLGTAGGLISNALIKKSQTKKGFDDIRCSVAGQFVAEYDDEFVVGMQ